MPIDEAILTQYALGILDEKEYKIVEQEVIESPALQKDLVSIQNVLEQIAFAEKPHSPNDCVRELVLDCTRKKSRYNGFIKRFSVLFDLDKLTSKELVSKIDNFSDTDWESTPIPGVSIMKFVGGPKVASATCGIVQVKPGKLFPAHEHQDDEKILVLNGVAQDDHGNVFQPGDMFLFTKTSRHSFCIIGDQTFIFAVVLNKENKWLLFKTLIDNLRIKKY